MNTSSADLDAEVAARETRSTPEPTETVAEAWTHIKDQVIQTAGDGEGAEHARRDLALVEAAFSAVLS